MPFQRSNSSLNSLAATATNSCVGVDPFPNAEAVVRWLANCGCSANSLVQPNDSPQADSRQKRKQEFHAGRNLAMKMLADYGEYRSVSVNDDRSPRWPDGFVGSISHSSEWVWAAVARAMDVLSIGIDTERVVDDRTRQQIHSEIASNQEWKIADSLGLDSQQAFSVVFSAKEAFYKCWYPVTKNYFGFQHAAVESASPDRVRIRTLETNPNAGLSPSVLDVFFLCRGNNVFTATWMGHEKQ